MADLTQLFKNLTTKQPQSIPQTNQGGVFDPALGEIHTDATTGKKYQVTPTGRLIGEGVNTGLYNSVYNATGDAEAAKQAALTGQSPTRNAKQAYTSANSSNNIVSQQGDNLNTQSSAKKTYSNEEVANAVNRLGALMHGGSFMPQSGSASDILALQDQAAKDRLNSTGLYGRDGSYALSPDQLSSVNNSTEDVYNQRLQTLGDVYQNEQKQSVQKNNNLGGGLSQLNDKQFSVYSTLANNFDNLTKTQRGTVNAYNGIKDVGELAKTGNPQAQIGIIYQFMRSLDPTSTVKEGEYATAQNSAGVPDRVRIYWNQLEDGTRLNNKQIDGFIETAKSLASTADKELSIFAKQQANRAKLGGVPVSLEDFYTSDMYDTPVQNSNNGDYQFINGKWQ